MILVAIGAVVSISSKDDSPGTPRDDPSRVVDETEGPYAQIARHDHQSPVLALAFAPGDARLASASGSGEVWLTDVANSQRILVQRGTSFSTKSLGFSPEGTILVCAGDSPEVRLLDSRSREEFDSLDVDGTPSVHRVAYSGDGRRIAAAGSGRLLVIWEWPSRRRIVVRDQREGTSSLAFSPDGSLLATGDTAGLIKIRDPSTGHERAVLPGHGAGNSVTSLAFSPDGSTLATASFIDRSVRLWHMPAGKPRESLPIAACGVMALAFSPDGKLLALARGDGTAILWGMSEGRELGCVQANDRALLAIGFSGDGRTLATGGADGSLRLWDMNQVVGSKR